MTVAQTREELANSASTKRNYLNWCRANGGVAHPFVYNCSLHTMTLCVFRSQESQIKTDGGKKWEKRWWPATVCRCSARYTKTCATLWPFSWESATFLVFQLRVIEWLFNWALYISRNIMCCAVSYIVGEQIYGQLMVICLISNLLFFSLFFFFWTSD